MFRAVVDELSKQATEDAYAEQEPDQIAAVGAGPIPDPAANPAPVYETQPTPENPYTEAPPPPPPAENPAPVYDTQPTPANPYTEEAIPPPDQAPEPNPSVGSGNLVQANTTPQQSPSALVRRTYDVNSPFNPMTEAIATRFGWGGLSPEDAYHQREAEYLYGAPPDDPSHHKVDAFGATLADLKYSGLGQAVGNAIGAAFSPQPPPAPYGLHFDPEADTQGHYTSPSLWDQSEPGPASPSMGGPTVPQLPHVFSELGVNDNNRWIENFDPSTGKSGEPSYVLPDPSWQTPSDPVSYAPTATPPESLENQLYMDIQPPSSMENNIGVILAEMEQGRRARELGGLFGGDVRRDKHLEDRRVSNFAWPHNLTHPEWSGPAS